MALPLPPVLRGEESLAAIRDETALDNSGGGSYPCVIMNRSLIRWVCILATLIPSALVISACATSAGPTPKPTNRMARLGRVSIDTLNVGYETYKVSCVECHTDKVPKPPVDRAWHPASMGLNLYQSLSAEQRYGVLSYLRAVEASRFKVHGGSLQDSSL